MNRIAKFALVALVLVAVAVGAFALLFDVNQYRGTLQTQLEASLKKKVTLGPMSLGVFPPALRVQDLAIGENPPLVTAKELRVRPSIFPLLRGQVDIASLELINPVFELVETSPGHWNYETPQEPGSAPASESSSEFSLGKLFVDDGRVAIQSLDSPREVYDHIDLTLNNYAPGKTFTADLTVDLPRNLKLDAGLKARNEASALTVDALNAHLGDLHLTGSGRLASDDTNFSIKVDESNISALAQAAAAFGKAFAPGMKVAGTLSADVKVTGPTDHLAYNGTVQLKSLEFSEAKWSQPVRIPQATLTLTPESIQTNTFTVESGATNLTASAQVNSYATDNGSFEARLSAPNAQLEELLHMASLYGGAELSGVSATGRAALNVAVQGKLPNEAAANPPVNYSGSGSLTDASIKLPSLTKPVEISGANLQFSDDRISVDRLALTFGSTHATGKASIRGFARPEVQFNASIDKLAIDELQKSVVETRTTPAVSAPAATTERNQPLTLRGSGDLSIGQLTAHGVTLNNVKTHMQAANGVITLDPVTANVFGGSQAGSIVVDTRPAVTTIALRTKVQRVEANQLLTSTTSLDDKLFGLIAANGNISVAPQAGQDIARSLNGTLGVELTKGRLAGINIVNEMAGVAKLLGFRQQGEAVTNIVGLTGNLQFNDGVAKTDNLKMVFDGGSLAAAGTVNLVTQALDLKVTTVMSKSFTDQFSGGKIGGLLTSALTNRSGELVIPALVSGTMSSPRFAPDAAEVARLKVSGIAGSAAAGVLDAVTGGKGAKGILDSITKSGTERKQEQSQEAQQEGEQKAAPNPAGKLLDLLKKRKQ